MTDREKLLSPLDKIRLKRLEQRVVKSENSVNKQEDASGETASSKQPRRRRGRKPLSVKKEKQNEKGKKDEETGDESDWIDENED